MIDKMMNMSLPLILEFAMSRPLVTFCVVIFVSLIAAFCIFVAQPMSKFVKRLEHNESAAIETMKSFLTENESFTMGVILYCFAHTVAPSVDEKSETSTDKFNTNCGFALDCSPFVEKAEYCLRAQKIPYIIVPTMKNGKNGKLPRAKILERSKNEGSRDSFVESDIDDSDAIAKLLRNKLCNVEGPEN